jgi:predicted O-methyltransferase YrrM
VSTFEECWVAVADVQGWMTRGQAEALYDAAAACPPGGTIVESGSFHGRSTIVLALAAPDGARVVAIDPHAGNDRGPREIAGFEAEADDDHAVFTKNLLAAGVADRVTHLRMFSDDALAEIDQIVADGTIDVLYVDGAHRYAPARADIEQWGAKVGAGGIMLIHDSFSSVGVTLAILRVLAFGDRFRYVSRSRSLAVYEKSADVRRVTNAARQLAQLPWFAKNLAVKVLLTAGMGKLFERAGRTPPAWPY